MKKSLVISEQDSIAALLENDRVVEFFVNRGELLLGDVYTATVENILPGIDAAFVNLGKDKMGFLHANDVPGQGLLKERLVPKQRLLVQITKEPTGHKGPRVSTAISLPGRFLVLVPEERGVSISRRISEARERARLKSVTNLLKPPGVGLIIRTEAKGQGEQELFEDFEQLWDRWQSIVSDAEASIGPTLIYRDQDLLYRVIRDAYSTDINEVVVDSADGQKRAVEFLSGWTGRSNTQIVLHAGEEPLLVAKGIDREIEAALSERVELPSGGHLNIEPTEALTVIDVNSGRFTSSRTQAETVRRTNLEAAQEIPRQLRLRNVGGMVIVDFIDMESRKDQQQVLEAFQRALEDDRAKPQVGGLSDLGLVELTRRRQGQSLRELFTAGCPTCAGLGAVPTLEVGSRLISTRPKEEEAVSARGRAQARRGQRSQGPLRAATISSGRVQSTVVSKAEAAAEESEAEEVPPEILEQMPDDLLESRRQPAAFSDESVDGADEAVAAAVDEEEDYTHEIIFESDTALPPPSIFEEEFEEEEADELGVAITEVEEVRQQLDQPESEEEGEEEEYEITYSPFEAEPEEFAGVFRLKAKEAHEAAEDAVGASPTPPADASGEDSGQAETAGYSFGEPSSEPEQFVTYEFTSEEEPQAESSREDAEGWQPGVSSAQQLELSLTEGDEEQEEEGLSVSAGFPGGHQSSYTAGSEFSREPADEE